jgi:hypothetical protein
MPAPGDSRPAHFAVALRDLIWEFAYAPVAAIVGWLADRMNYLQFLTIRQYLSLVFGTLVTLLLALATWQ